LLAEAKPRLREGESVGVVIGVMVATMQLTVYGGLGLMAGEGRDAMIGDPRLTIWSGRIAGLLLIVAAAYTLWHGWQGL
jgi:threonine/homoserine/homoserine lactone efflux protein